MDTTEHVLNEAERARLGALEQMLDRQARSFVDKGLALKEIRDGKLFREGFDTFEAYSLGRWQMSRPRAYQLIAAAEVAGNLSTIVDILQPANECQVRPLTRLAPERQRAVWAKAVAESAGQPTVTDVGRFLRAEQEGLLAESGGGGAVANIYLPIVEMIENCRRLHRQYFAPKSRADLVLDMYLAIVRGTRTFSWPRTG